MKPFLAVMVGFVLVSAFMSAVVHRASADDVCTSCGGTGRGMVACPVCGGTGIAEYVRVHGQMGAYGCTNCGGVRGDPYRTDWGNVGRQGTGRVMGVCSACNGTGKPGPAQLRQEARNTNEEGVRRYNNKDWAGAIACFEEANRKAPDDNVIAKNLQNARDAKQRDDWEKEQRRKEAITAGNMRDALSDFSKQLETLTPTTVEGLDFDGSRSPAAPNAGATALDFARPLEMVYSDPMVVDLRDAVRKSVNMAVVSGGMPPASQAQNLQFINPLKPAPPSAPPPPQDPQQEDIMAVFNDPKLEDAFTDFLVAKVTGDKEGEKQANAKGAALAAEAVEKLTSKKHERLTKDQKMEILKQLSAEVGAVHDRIRKQELADFETARLHYSQNVDAGLDALRKKGILRPGDDIVEKVVNDPKVSKAVDEMLTNCTQKLQAEYLEIDKKAMKDLASEVTHIFKRPIEGVDDIPAPPVQQ